MARPPDVFVAPPGLLPRPAAAFIRQRHPTLTDNSYATERTEASDAS